MGGVKVAIRATNIRVDKIIYTGSTEKGILVAQAAAKNLVPCILELGGKSPCIVDNSCDLDHTALKVAHSAFLMFGQICVRPDYVLIDHTIVNKFVDLLKVKMEAIHKDGKCKDLLGKAINDFHHERICALLKDHQGTVLIGNANAHIDKNLTPTVILNPSP